MRRFDSEEERVRLYKLVYEDPHWTNVIKPHIDEMLDRAKIIVTRLVADTAFGYTLGLFIVDAQKICALQHFFI